MSMYNGNGHHRHHPGCGQTEAYITAYAIACKYGFKGTEEEWLASLQGNTGLSAYDMARDAGYTGTEEEFAAEQAGFAENARLAAEAADAAEADRNLAERAADEAEGYARLADIRAGSAWEAANQASGDASKATASAEIATQAAARAAGAETAAGEYATLAEDAEEMARQYKQAAEQAQQEAQEHAYAARHADTAAQQAKEDAEAAAEEIRQGVADGRYRGEKGDQGPAGPAGPAGERGPAGATGERGIQGVQGVPGVPGRDGVDGQKGESGATFTPTINADGILSWTNDKGKLNPAPVNVRGPKGERGETGERGEPGASATEQQVQEAVEAYFDANQVEGAVDTVARAGVSRLSESIAEIADIQLPTNYWKESEKVFVIKSASDYGLNITYPTDDSIIATTNGSGNVHYAIGIDVEPNTEYSFEFKCEDKSETSKIQYSPKDIVTGLSDVQTFEKNEQGVYSVIFTSRAESDAKAYLYIVQRSNNPSLNLYDIVVTKKTEQKSVFVRTEKIRNLNAENFADGFIDGFATREEVASFVEDAKINLWNDSQVEIVENTVGTILHSFPTDNSLKLWHSASANHYGRIQIPCSAGVRYTIGLRLTNGEFKKGGLFYTPTSARSTSNATYLVEDENGFLTAKVTPISEYIYIQFDIAYDVALSELSAITLEEIHIFAGDSYEQTKKVKNSMLIGIGEESLSDELIAKMSFPKNPCEYVYFNDIAMFNKGLCIGDSLTAGVFNYRESGSNQLTTIPKYSYPSILHKITGVELTNMGIGGKTSAQWYDLKKDEDLSGFDFAIIQLGVNDALQLSGWTDTSKTAFINIINKLKQQNKNIKVFVSTVIRAISYSGSAYDSVSNGIRNLVAELNDTNVILLDMALYSHTMDEQAYNQGHLTAFGHTKLASDYKSYISWYMNTHKDEFRNVQFIGTDMDY